MLYYIYVLQCRGGRLYTGITTDIKRRFAEHSGGAKGAKFTRSNPPEKIMAVWVCEGRSAASKLEYAIKKLSHEQKLRLLSNSNYFSELFGDESAKLYSRKDAQFC